MSSSIKGELEVMKEKKNRKSKNLSVIEEKDNYNLRAAMIHVIGKRNTKF
jgi:hypothetical protein